MSLDKAITGSPLKIPSGDYNAFIDAAKAHIQKRNDQGGVPLGEIGSGTIIRAINVESSDMPKFAIVRLDGSPFDIGDNPHKQRNNHLFNAKKPNATSTKIAVLQKPCKAGATVKAVTLGLTVAQVNITDVGHTQVKAVSNDSDKFESTSSGGVGTIEHKDATTTGITWCIVLLLSKGGSDIILVQPTGDIAAGSSGSCTVIQAQADAGVAVSSTVTVTNNAAAKITNGSKHLAVQFAGVWHSDSALSKSSGGGIDGYQQFKRVKLSAGFSLAADTATVLEIDSAGANVGASFVVKDYSLRFSGETGDLGFAALATGDTWHLISIDGGAAFAEPILESPGQPRELILSRGDAPFAQDTGALWGNPTHGKNVLAADQKTGGGNLVDVNNEHVIFWDERRKKWIQQQPRSTIFFGVVYSVVSAAVQASNVTLGSGMVELYHYDDVALISNGVPAISVSSALFRILSAGTLVTMDRNEDGEHTIIAAFEPQKIRLALCQDLGVTRVVNDGSTTIAPIVDIADNIGSVVTIDDVCWSVIEACTDCIGENVTYQELFTDCTDCNGCFLLSDCSNKREDIKVTGRILTPHIGKVISYDGSCWSVTSSSGCDKDSVELTDYDIKNVVVDCDSCAPFCYKLTPCGSGSISYVSFLKDSDGDTITGLEGRIVRVGLVCYYVSIADGTGCLGGTFSTVEEVYDDCSGCSPYVATPCLGSTGSARTTNQDLSQYVGKVVRIQGDADPLNCYTITAGTSFSGGDESFVVSQEYANCTDCKDRKYSLTPSCHGEGCGLCGTSDPGDPVIYTDDDLYQHVGKYTRFNDKCYLIGVASNSVSATETTGPIHDTCKECVDVGVCIQVLTKDGTNDPKWTTIVVRAVCESIDATGDCT